MNKRSLAHALRGALTQEPDKEALVLVGPDGEQHATRAEVDAHARYTAQRLSAGGVQAGDVILMLMDHSYEALPMFLGALYMGAVPMILPYLTPQTTPAQQTERLAGLVQFFQPKVLLTLPRYQSDIDSLGLTVTSLAWDFNGDETASAPEVVLSTRSDEDLAYLQFTSGTTGQPKAVMVSHRALLEAFEVGAERFSLSAADVCVLAAPLSHASGLAGAGLHMIWLGIRSVILAPSYWAQNPASLLHAIHRYRGTYSILTNTGLNLTMFRVQPEEIAGVDLSSLRLMVVGSEMIAPATLQMFTQKFAAFGFKSNAFTTAYAASEAYIAFQSADSHWRAESVSAGALVADKVASPVAAESQDARAVTSCGTPLRGVTIQIQDEAGNVLEERRLGQIVVKTGTAFSGYWNHPDLTAVLLKDGWYYTGDLGYLANGELFVVGRIKDLIIVGGRNLLPDAVEERAMAALRGTLRGAVAFGVRDEVMGTEQPVVVCELAAPLDETARGQAAQAVRAGVRQLLDVTLADVYFVESGWIIRAGGKLARNANREKYLAEYQPSTLAGQTTEQRSPLQQVIAIFEQVLGHKPVRSDDNFFDLGGDSISALKMLLLVEKQFGRSIPTEFYQQPTVAHLVKLLEMPTTEQASASDTKPAPIEAPRTPVAPPLLQRASAIAATPHLLPQRVKKRLHKQVGRYAFRRSYFDGMRWLANWSGNPWVQRFLYPQEVRIVHEFCASLGGSTLDFEKSDMAKFDIAKEVQRSIMGNIFLSGLFPFAQSADAAQTIRELLASSLPLLRELGQAMSDPDGELGKRIFAIHGSEHLQESVRPGQGIVGLTFHATTSLVSMGPLLQQRGSRYWIGASTFRNILRARYGKNTQEEFDQHLPELRAHAAQVARDVLSAGGLVGITGDATDRRSPVRVAVGDRLRPPATGFAELALATGAAVIPTYTVLQLDGRLSQYILPAFDAGDDRWSHHKRVEHLVHQTGGYLLHAWQQAPGTLDWRNMERHLQTPKVGTSAPVQPLPSQV